MAAKTPQCSIDGRVIAQPFAGAMFLITYYNKKVFSKLGITPPESWEEMLAVCEKIKASGIIPIFYAGKDAWTLDLLPTVAGIRDYAGKFNDYVKQYHTNKIKNIDRKNWIDGMYKLKELVEKGFVNESFLSDTHDMAQIAITEQKAAMYIAPSALITRMVTKFPDTYKDIGAFAIPVGDKDHKYAYMSIGKTLSATDKIKDVERAKELFNYIATDEVQMAYFEKTPDLPVYLGISSDKLDIPPALKDIVDMLNNGLICEPAILKKYQTDFSISQALQNLLATKNYTPEDIAREWDEAIAKVAKLQNDPNW